MSTLERIHQLMERNGINAAKLLRETDLHHTTLTKWKVEGYKPFASTVLKIANYFGVSTDYLLCGNEFDTRSILESSGVVIPPPLQELYKDIYENSGGFSQADIDEIARFIDFIKLKQQDKDNKRNIHGGF